MAEAGMRLRHDLASESIMGFAEVLKHFPEIRRLFLDTVDHLRKVRPDVLVLVDYPGFNIRLAKEARKLNIRIVYYISPQVWAWKRGRLKTLAQTVDKMLVIFPFEERLYREAGLDCAYVGHPLVDHLSEFTPTRYGGDGKCVGLLPGSRSQEISRLLPVMVEAAKRLKAAHPEVRFLMPCVNEARAAQIRAGLNGLDAEVIIGGMHEVLSSIRFAWVASGTATLETALFGVPMCIVYKVHPLTFAIAKRVVDVQHIGIVNILADRRIVPELVQHEATPDALLRDALPLFEDTPRRAQALSDLRLLKASLGGGGASRRAAEEILAITTR